MTSVHRYPRFFLSPDPVASEASACDGPVGLPESLRRFGAAQDAALGVGTQELGPESPDGVSWGPFFFFFGGGVFLF